MKTTKVLLVDDEKSFTNLLKLNLEQTGSYEVRMVNWSEDAMPAAREFKPNIVLLDDNPAITQMVAEYLQQRERYEVRVENDSLCAIRVASEFRPDVAILDLGMPGKDGAEVAREFKNDPLLKDTAIIILNGQFLHEDKPVQDGVTYLPKPFLLTTLERVMEVVLSGHLSAATEPAVTTAGD